MTILASTEQRGIARGEGSNGRDLLLQNPGLRRPLHHVPRLAPDPGEDAGHGAVRARILTDPRVRHDPSVDVHGRGHAGGGP